MYLIGQKIKRNNYKDFNSWISNISVTTDTYSITYLLKTNLPIYNIKEHFSTNHNISIGE